MMPTELSSANKLIASQASIFGQAAIQGITKEVVANVQEQAAAGKLTPTSSTAATKALTEAITTVLITQDPASLSFRLWSVFWMIVGLVATSTDAQLFLAQLVGTLWAEGVGYLPFVVAVASVLWSKHKDIRPPSS